MVFLSPRYGSYEALSILTDAVGWEFRPRLRFKLVSVWASVVDAIKQIARNDVIQIRVVCRYGLFVNGFTPFRSLVALSRKLSTH